jgi:hypothetical protein
MSTIVLRSVKGSPLTNAEVDSNFTNLNNDKTELGGTYSSGTANGVLFLSASKVLTTGSALTFDGTNFGVGTSSPAYPIDVVASSSSAAIQIRGRSSDSVGSLQFATNAGVTTGVTYVSGLSGASGFLTFGTDATERMRITSAGNVGIGTSLPTNKLSVAGNANVTGNVTLGDASTDTVTVNGYMGVGGAASSQYGINIISTALTSASQRGIRSSIVGNSAATSLITSFSSSPSTAAESFTVADVSGIHLFDASKGAGSTITNQHGVYIANQSAGTNNFGITSLVASGTNKWNIYASGTAANYFAGNVQFAAGSAAAPALTRFGDDNTGIFFPAADTIAFAEGGAEAMRIDSAGNVGIGTTTITSSTGFKRLVINDTSGGILEQQVGGVATGRLITSSATVSLDAITGIPLTFKTSATERMRIDSAGNVGIGTSSPTNLFQVKGSVAAQMGVYRTNSTTGVGVGFEYAQNNASSAETVIAQTFGVLTTNTAGAEGGAFTVWTKNAGTLAERMRLDSSGNLGLGVTPSAWAAGAIAMEFGDYGGVWLATGGDFNFGTNAYNSAAGVYTYRASGLGAARYQSNFGVHRWFTAPSGTAGAAITFTSAMTLDASGNLGVGETSPTQAIYAKRAGAAAIQIVNSSASINFLAGVDSSVAYISAPNGTLTLNTAGSERARIDSSGNLLVGTTSSPSGNYDVKTASVIGNGAAFYGVNNSADSAYTVGLWNKATTGNRRLIAFYAGATETDVGSIVYNGTATLYNTTSDYRLKNTIAPMTGALAKVALLKPCTYKWNADGSDGEGFIAHELAEVVPQCVTGEKDAVDAEGKPQYQGIDTSFLVATLTAAIQEQQAIINSLKARLDAANI